MIFSALVLSIALAAPVQTKTLSDLQAVECAGASGGYARIDRSVQLSEFRIGSLPVLTNKAEAVMPIEIFENWPRKSETSIGGLVIDGGETVFGNASIVFSNAQTADLKTVEHVDLVFVDQLGRGTSERAECVLTFR